MSGRMLRKILRALCVIKATASMNFFKFIFFFFIIEVVLTITCPLASADLIDKPYLLRLLLTLDRQSNYASTLGRQASIAFPDGSSMNPAAGDWNQHTTPHTSLTATYVEAFSESGSQVLAVPVTARLQYPDIGSFWIAYAPTSTPDKSANGGLSDSLSSNEYFAGYSKRFADISLGIQFRYTDADVMNEFLSPAFGGQALRMKTDFSAYDFSVGLLTELSSGFTLGIVGVVGWGTADNFLENVNMILMPGSSLLDFKIVPPNTLLSSFPSNTKSLAVRGGLGFKPKENIGVYFDTDWVRVKSEPGGSADIGRFVLGTEYKPLSCLTLRGGLSMDTNAQVTVSAGFGYRISKSIYLDIGYEYNAAPELKPEHGSTQLLITSLAVTF